MNLLPFQFASTVRLGIKSLMLHKLRSVLMMLGIIFGVCSVIAMLAVGGGLVGVLVGVTTPIVVSQLTTMKTIVTRWSVLVAFGISGAVGISFGLYPAKAAARLDPIEAPRHE
jgi:putative ABC transport system permease protein